MSLFCKLLGHKVQPGYASVYGSKYLEVQYAGTDGMNVEHATLHTECERCTKRFQVGKIHMQARESEKALRRVADRLRADVISLQVDNGKRRGYWNPPLDAIAADFNYAEYCQLLTEVGSTAGAMTKASYDKFKTDILAGRAIETKQTLEPRHG